MNNAGKVKHSGLLKPLSIACFLQVFMASTAHAYNATGNEDRCEELGGNCYCAEAFNTDKLVKTKIYALNPADTTAKECKTKDGSAIGANNQTADETSHVLTGSSLSVTSRLTNNPEVKHYLRTMDGTNPLQHTAIFFAGAENVSPLKKRMAVRWYVYHSPDFVFKGINEEDCPITIKRTNTKFSQFKKLVGDFNGTFHFYTGWRDWTYNKGQNTVGDCCFDGPPTANAKIPLNTLQGNWLRFEAVITNPYGGPSPNGTVIKAYLKDVTNDGPEITLIDTSTFDPKVGKTNAWLGADDLTPVSSNTVIDSFMINNYREGTCAGFRAVSHYMLAGWDTDNGQRIGPAKEIESGAFNPNPLQKPRDWDAKSKIDKM